MQLIFRQRPFFWQLRKHRRKFALVKEEFYDFGVITVHQVIYLKRPILIGLFLGILISLTILLQR